MKVTKSFSTSATKLSHKHTTFDSALDHSICTERCLTVRTTAQSSLGAHYVLSLLRNAPSSTGELGAKAKIHLVEQEGWMCIIALEHIQITEREMTTGKIGFVHQTSASLMFWIEAAQRLFHHNFLKWY